MYTVSLLCFVYYLDLSKKKTHTYHVTHHIISDTRINKRKHTHIQLAYVIERRFKNFFIFHFTFHIQFLSIFACYVIFSFLTLLFSLFLCASILVRIFLCWLYTYFSNMCDIKLSSKHRSYFIYANFHKLKNVLYSTHCHHKLKCKRTC